MRAKLMGAMPVRLHRQSQQILNTLDEITKSSIPVDGLGCTGDSFLKRFAHGTFEGGSRETGQRGQTRWPHALRPINLRTSSMITNWEDQQRFLEREKDIPVIDERAATFGEGNVPIMIDRPQKAHLGKNPFACPP
jgi:hypothetical protein